MSRHKGNAYFTNPCRIEPPKAMESSFEEVVKKLCLSPAQYADSDELRSWVKHNKSFKYVPSDVLMVFGFKVGAEA